MFLKFKIRCACHCSYAINENISTETIVCPNCGIEYPYSKELLLILNTAKNIPEGETSGNRIEVISFEEDMKNFEL